MDAGDDVSDSASMYSVDRSVRSVRQRGGGVAVGVPRAAVAASVAGSVSKKPTDHRPVSTLKPKVRLTGFPLQKKSHPTANSFVVIRCKISSCTGVNEW